MHKEVSRIFELQEYLHFQSRSFKKIRKLKDDVPKEEQKDPLWADMDDSVDDLDQFDGVLNSLKERFNNLIDFEYNIQNATQSDNSAFLSAVATLFLPISFLASLFGITTITWPAIWYLYVAIPLVITSISLVLLYPLLRKWWEEARYHIGQLKVTLQPNDFTLLGSELPDSADVPGGYPSRTKRKVQRPGGVTVPVDPPKGDSRRNSRAMSFSRTRGEKEGS